MKTELSKIAQDLEQGTITNNEARSLLLGLLIVSESTSIRECSRCEYDNKLGFCPRCDTQAYSH
jgi:uncharacterized paraquat-inducible protein A